MKKTFARRLILSVAALTAVLVLAVWLFNSKAEAQNGSVEGSGSEGDPYRIEDADDLRAFAFSVNGGETYEGKTVVLRNNIDLSEVCGEDLGNWVPIGNADNAFAGTFKGQGNTISGLYIDSKSDVQGLFGVNAGRIENLTVYGSVKGKDYVGGITGKNLGEIENCESGVTVVAGIQIGGIAGRNDGMINNCLNCGDISSDDADDQKPNAWVGGIAGFSSKEISNCTNDADVISKGERADGYVGGIVGEADTTEARIINCQNNENHIVSAATGYVGGIVGRTEAEVVNCTNKAKVSGLLPASGVSVGGIACIISNTSINNCVNFGDIYSNLGDVGGIAEHIEVFGTITNCTNVGNVSNLDANGNGGANNLQAGGIVADVYASLEIKNCVNSGKISGGCNAGGIAGYMKNEKSENEKCEIVDSTNQGSVSGTAFVGGIGAYVNCEVKNCVNNGEISGTDTVGGIVGFIDYSSIIDSTNKGSVSGTQEVGGIAGQMFNCRECVNCFNSGAVFGEQYVGGVVGYAETSIEAGTGKVVSCTNTNNVTGKQYVGGIVGVGNTNIIDCINRGTVNATSGVGGILGSSDDKGLMRFEGNSENENIIREKHQYIENCVNNGVIKGNQYVAGIIGQNEDCSIFRCANYADIYGYECVGGILGGDTKFYENLIHFVKQCLNNGNIIAGSTEEGINSYGKIGGIVGCADDARILNCENSGSVTSVGECVGGIAGIASLCEVQECGNTGTISSTEAFVGGIVGYFDKKHISDCYNRGIVYGLNSVGGILGYFIGTSIDRVYCKAPRKGIVSGKYGVDCIADADEDNKDTHVGALIAEKWYKGDYPSSINDCYWWSRCSHRAMGDFRGSIRYGQNYLYGKGYDYYYYESRFEKPSNFANWDFDNVWFISNGVPELRTQFNINPSGGVGGVGGRGGKGGTGYTYTKTTTLYISSMEEFKNFRDDVNSGNSYVDKSVYLTTDLDLKDEAWVPIGTVDNPFKGYFSGENHIISGLKVSGEVYDAGLFGYCFEADIWSLVVFGDVSVEINGTGYETVGTGGIVGSAYTTSVYNCMFFGNVSCKGTLTDFNAGGIVGIGSGDIVECGHVGAVSVAQGYAGGVAGNLSGRYSDVENCFHYGGKISSGESDKAGGIVAKTAYESGMKHNYALSGDAEHITGTSDPNGNAMLTEEQFRDKSNFAEWIIGDKRDNTWGMSWDYPVLIAMSDYIFVSSNGGDDEPRVVWMIKDHLEVLETTLTREGYLFNGWNDKADGTGTAYYNGDPVSKEITLYAQWVKGVAYHDYILYAPASEVTGYSNQTYDLLMDNDVKTKWGTPLESGEANWSLEFATKDYVRPGGYGFVTAENAAKYTGRNPKGWILEGKKNADGEWVELDKVTDDDLLPGRNHVAVNIPLEIYDEYCYFRITFLGVKDGTVFQMSEFYLFTADPTTDVRKPRILFESNGVDVEELKAVPGDTESNFEIPGDLYRPGGYKFLSWNTKPDGTGKTYNEGDYYVIKGDATLYAQWEALTYRLILELDVSGDGSVYKEFDYTADTDIVFDAPTRRGYTFDGWRVVSRSVDGDNWDYSEMFAGNDTVTGKYGNVTLAGCWTELTEYYVWWYNGEELLAEEKYYEGETPSYKGDKPVKKSDDEFDYTFKDWDKTLSPITESTEFYAEYDSTRRSYEITWKDENGKVIDTTTVEYGTKPTHSDLKKDATDEFAYDFAGWEPAVSAVTGKATYQAKFDATRRSYEITWKDEKGNVIDTTTVEYGTVPTHAPGKDKADDQYSYVFSGWTPSIAKVTGPATYSMVYAEATNSYEITWKDDLGNVIDITTVEYGTVPTHPELLKDQTDEFTYDFAGWEPAVSAVTGAATYQAKFDATRRSYEITWKDDLGNIIDTTTVEYGTVPTHADVKKDQTDEFSYDFAGWEPAVSAVTGAATYRAKFEETRRSYQITWKDENGKVIDTTLVEYGTVPTHEPGKDKSDDQYTYVFSGWTPSIAKVTGPAEYSMVYAEASNSYEITWKDEQGNVIDTTIVEYGTVPTHPELLKDATDEFSYEFAGWEPAVSAVTGPATYQAKFDATKRSYAITWKDDNDYVIDVTTVEYGVVPTHEDPTKEATEKYRYTFSGWDKTPVVVTGPATYKAVFTSEEIIVIDPTVPVLTDEQKVTAKADLTENDTEQELVIAPKSLPDGFVAVEYSKDGGKTWTESVPTEKEAGDYTISVRYIADDRHKDFEADTVEVTIKAIYTVVWLDGDGEELESKTYVQGDAEPTTDKTPTKTDDVNNYTFTGWDEGVVSGKTKTYSPIFSWLPKELYLCTASADEWYKDSDVLFVYIVKRAVDDQLCHSLFRLIEVDGTAAERGTDYSDATGSTIITFSEKYLESLAEGTHKVRIVFEDGEVSTALNIKPAKQAPVTPTPTEAPATPTPTEAPATPTPTEAPATPTPTEAPATPTPTEVPATPTPTPVISPEEPANTGDSSNLAIWVTLIAVSVTSLAIVEWKRRRRNAE